LAGQVDFEPAPGDFSMMEPVRAVTNFAVIASVAKQSSFCYAARWIASLRSQ